MLNKIFLFLILLLIWLVMSGIFSPLLLGLGVASCLISVIIYSLLDEKNTHKFSAIRPIFGSFGYWLWLAKEIVVSSWGVAMKMWQLEPDISPKMAWINTSLKNDVSMTILGNSITLTPGTVTVEVNKEGMFQVHALTEEGMEDLRSGDMVERVIKVMK